MVFEVISKLPWPLSQNKSCCAAFHMEMHFSLSTKSNSSPYERLCTSTCFNKRGQKQLGNGLLLSSFMHSMKTFQTFLFDNWQMRIHGGLMGSALVSGSSNPGSSPCRGHCILFLGKTLYRSSTSIHPGEPGYALAWWATGPLRVYLIGTACYSGAKKVDSQKPLCFIQNAAVLIAKGWKETYCILKSAISFGFHKVTILRMKIACMHATGVAF